LYDPNVPEFISCNVNPFGIKLNMLALTTHQITRMQAKNKRKNTKGLNDKQKEKEKKNEIQTR
jgi:hypothetical protein